MSKQIGKLLTCDRCKCTVFLPWEGNGIEWARDSDDSNFKSTPDGWGNGALYTRNRDRYSVADLCPDCLTEYLNQNKKFWSGWIAEEATPCDI